MHTALSKLIYLSLSLAIASLNAEDKSAPEWVPTPGKFAPLERGHFLMGELVFVDHVNRLGAIRLCGNGESDPYHRAEPHRFAMLPYGTIRYQGAPADLRDIPIGTVLHGWFFLPPEGDETVPEPPEGKNKYFRPYTHCAALEDHSSYCQSRELKWKIQAVELMWEDPAEKSPHFPPNAQEGKGDWRKIHFPRGKLRAVRSGNETEDKLEGDQVFTIDRSTRLWRGRQNIDWEDLAPNTAWTPDMKGQQLVLNLEDGPEVQMNLTWSEYSEFGRFHISDIWLDGESRANAAELQRRRHVHHMEFRWLPARVDEVEHLGQGRGRVTATLFGGMDSSLYDPFLDGNRQTSRIKAASAENTLRSWWQEHDGMSGTLESVSEDKNPPHGSSGIQLEFEVHRVLEGFRPGRIIRIRPHHWPNVKLPPEERVKDLSERFPDTFHPRQSP